MRVLAIDPGSVESAWILVDVDSLLPLDFGIWPNEKLARFLSHTHFAWRDCKWLAIEMMASYGMPVGADVFETCVWVGRFIAVWGGPFTQVYRKDVKLTLCGDTRARDSNIRQALIDRYPRTGGGKVPQIGTKAKPGPLYGVSRDIWQALAVAVTWIEKDGRSDCRREGRS